MANCDNLFKVFNEELHIPLSKNGKLKGSRKELRKRIRDYFAKNHPTYKPKFYTQGSYVMGTTIRTKDDTCDLDDGVYFDSNPDNVTCTTLQKWVKEAVDGTTDASPSHRKKCITVDYKAGYNIDLPVLLFDNKKDAHPSLAVKDGNWQDDDPKEFITKFNSDKDAEEQIVRIVRYLKAWCDYKREKMPSGLAMTILAMNNIQKNTRDDVALKYTLIEIEQEIKQVFQCVMPTTPKDNIFKDYDASRKDNFMTNLADFIADAKKAVDEEKNQLKASRLWQKHFGSKYFPNGEDVAETATNASLLSSTIGNSKPYFGAL
ncbi:MAG TPA: CBASS cGAMP synthase [Segetibacter sp.]|jgi:hypothetical protein